MKLFLRRDNVITVVHDWVYEFPPTIIYHRFDESSLVIDTYEFDYIHNNKAFYKFLS